MSEHELGMQVTAKGLHWVFITLHLCKSSEYNFR